MAYVLFRYKAYKERMQRMYVVPRYDPVFVEPNLKEYETQVCKLKYVYLYIYINKVEIYLHIFLLYVRYTD